MQALLEVLKESKICGDGIAENPPDKVWKMISIRTPTTGLHMVTFELAISCLGEEMGVIESMITDFVRKKLDLEALGIVSVNIKYSRGPKCSSDLSLPVIRNIIGQAEIYEDLLGLRFNISPESFFQTNTKGAEVLYETIRKIIISGYSASCLERSIVLDICCGTGTIALIMSKLVKCVYGVELCADAVKNAEINANLNGITNASFICGDVTNVINNQWISTLFTENDVKEEPLIAILDPPRAGVDISVIRCLRLCNNVKRILYVACNPAGIMKNIACFTRNRTNSMKGDPFNLIQCVPVDMFPHTKHCEAIFVLER